MNGGTETWVVLAQVQSNDVTVVRVMNERAGVRYLAFQQGSVDIGSPIQFTRDPAALDDQSRCRAEQTARTLGSADAELEIGRLAAAVEKQRT